ncbi:hypothetical protein HC891_26940, partial [Candidatus Gracilibacteria bacterium]|nr:hypothetical protein [Candidatus Gracilibacteria bacterium]
TLNTAGEHAITVRDGTRWASSTSVRVHAVRLVIVASPSTVFAGEAGTTVTVEARDETDQLVAGYRGTVIFTSTSTIQGLPQGGLGGSTYTFTAADAGRHGWTGVTLDTAGSHTIGVSDGTRQATSAPVTVGTVTLAVTVSQVSGFVCDPRVTVTVTARDDQGQLVPGYRGRVTFTSSSAFDHLPKGGLGGDPYTFTASDAGSKTWSTALFFTAGAHTLSVSDGTRTATSAPFTLAEVVLAAQISGEPGIFKTPTLTLTVEARDSAGQLVPSYACPIDLTPSAPVHNLPQSTFQATPDYTFTPTDGGRKVFPDFAFLATGPQQVMVQDRGNPARQATTPSLTVSMPGDPTPIPASAPPVAQTVSVPAERPNAQALPYGWFEPFTALGFDVGLNGWQGYPPQEVVASPGAYPIVSGVAQRSATSPWWSTFYPCPAVGWENPITNQRESGGATGYLVYQDVTFTKVSVYGCGRWSDQFNNGAPATFGPWFPEDQDAFEEGLAPAGTQGIHASVQAAGNTIGNLQVNVTPISANVCSVPHEGSTQGNPVDVRSGAKVQTEHDLGVATGCEEVALSFVRTYRSDRPEGGALGSGWVHSFEQRIVRSNNTVLVQMPRGEYLLFQDVGSSVYATWPGSQHTLIERADGGYALIWTSQRVDIFDAAGRLIAIQDPNGNMLWLTYETYDQTTVDAGRYQGTRLARVDAPGGRYLWFGYDYYLPQRLVLVGDHSGRTVRFGYDMLTHERPGRLTQVTDPLGHTATYAYDGWLLQAKTNARGEVEFRNTFDAGGRVVQQVNSRGQTLTFAYSTVPDSDGLLAGTGLAPRVLKRIVTDQTGAQISYLFGPDGLLRQMTDPAGATTTYRGYTATRKPTEIEDGLGRITRFSYDSRGMPTTITNALNQTTQVAYDSWSRVTQQTDALNRRSTFVYTGANLTRVIDALGQTVVLTYTDQAGWRSKLSTVADQEGRTTQLRYDVAGDLTEIVDALNQVTTIGYDSLGRPTDLVDAKRQRTTIQYDARDQIRQITDALGGTVRVDYDPAGNPVRITTRSARRRSGPTAWACRAQPIAMRRRAWCRDHDRLWAAGPPDHGDRCAQPADGVPLRSGRARHRHHRPPGPHHAYGLRCAGQHGGADRRQRPRDNGALRCAQSARPGRKRSRPAPPVWLRRVGNVHRAHRHP